MRRKTFVMARTCVIYKMYNAWVPFQNILSKMQKNRRETSTMTDEKKTEKRGKTRLHPQKEKKKSFATPTQLLSARDWY